MEGYKIKIQQFEGPFDLLLFFIERDELDIYDIPIAKITDDFLSYIRQLELLNIDVASEFILMAATLMRIKSKMLLPRKEVNEEGQELDPREELTRKLLEYKQFKEVIGEMRNLEETRAMKFDRPWASSQLKEIADQALLDIELESLSLYKLMKAFERAILRFEENQKVNKQDIMHFPYTIEEQSSYIFKKLKSKKKLDFISIFEEIQNRVHAIITFLALLELLNMQKVTLIEKEGVNNFEIKIAKPR